MYSIMFIISLKLVFNEENLYNRLTFNYFKFVIEFNFE